MNRQKVDKNGKTALEALNEQNLVENNKIMVGHYAGCKNESMLISKITELEIEEVLENGTVVIGDEFISKFIPKLDSHKNWIWNRRAYYIKRRFDIEMKVVNGKSVEIEE